MRELIQVGVEIDVREIVDWTTASLERVENAGPLMKELEFPMRNHLLQHMADQSGPGGRWAPLTPKYAREKARHSASESILIRTGAALESLTQESDATSVAALFADPVMIFHNDGTTRMAQRPPAWMSEAFIDQQTEAIATYFAIGALPGGNA